MVGEESTPHRLLSEIDRRIIEARSRFKRPDALVNHYYRLKLACLVETYQSAPTPSGWSQIKNVLSSISALTFGAEIVRDFVEVGSTPVFPITEYEFPTDSYTPDYAASYLKFSHLFSLELVRTKDHESLAHRFIYVVGNSGQWRYCVQPQPIAVTVFGRADVLFYPFHPVLSHGLSDRIYVAGEISFHWQPSEAAPKWVLVNNVSGHYRPKEWSATALAAYIKHVLRLPDYTFVLSVANDGASVVRGILST